MWIMIPDSDCEEGKWVRESTVVLLWNMDSPRGYWLIA